jgi:hypothetical protein
VCVWLVMMILIRTGCVSQIRKGYVDEDIVKEAIMALKSSEVSIKDILGYIQSNYPAIANDSDKWKRQAKVLIRKMADKGALQKKPSTFSIA